MPLSFIFGRTTAVTEALSSVLFPGDADLMTPVGVGGRGTRKRCRQQGNDPTPMAAAFTGASLIGRGPTTLPEIKWCGIVSDAYF